MPQITYEVVRAQTEHLGILAFRPKLTEEQLSSLPLPRFYESRSEQDPDLSVPVFIKENGDSLEVAYLLHAFLAGYERFPSFASRVISSIGSCAVYPAIYSVSEYDRQNPIFDIDKVAQAANYAA